jgi:hypothetical protein
VCISSMGHEAAVSSRRAILATILLNVSISRMLQSSSYLIGIV